MQIYLQIQAIGTTSQDFKEHFKNLVKNNLMSESDTHYLLLRKNYVWHDTQSSWNRVNTNITTHEQTANKMLTSPAQIVYKSEKLVIDTS